MGAPRGNKNAAGKHNISGGKKFNANTKRFRAKGMPKLAGAPKSKHQIFHPKGDFLKPSDVRSQQRELYKWNKGSANRYGNRASATKNSRLARGLSGR